MQQGNEKMNELTYYNAAKTALAQASRVDEVKDVKDKAEAIRLYAQQQKDEDLEHYAAMIKARAMRRMGELSRDLEIHPQAKGGRLTTSEQPTKTQVLKNAGISLSTANRAEQLAAIPEEKFEEQIADDVTIKEILRIAKKEERFENLEKQSLEDKITGKFNVIYADPPWQYNNSGFSGSANQQYTTMSTEEICSMPVKDYSADEAVLFLWATNPFLKDALRVIESWGFEYKTNMVWTKENPIGMGFYCLGQHELLLIATKDSFLPNTKESLPPSVLRHKNLKHSQKPEVFYNIIEKLYSGCSYLELFGRNKREKWETFGNES